MPNFSELLHRYTVNDVIKNRGGPHMNELKIVPWHMIPLNEKYHNFTSESLEPIDQWCEKNTTGKWSKHWLRVIRTTDGMYSQNEVFGKNTIFYCFEDQDDATIFALRW
jgi:hypothetical protein